MFMFFCNGAATSEIYTYLHTLSLHDALPISRGGRRRCDRGSAWRRPQRRQLQLWLRRAHRLGMDRGGGRGVDQVGADHADPAGRSEAHTSELQSLMRISYAVFCLKKKTKQTTRTYIQLNAST